MLNRVFKSFTSMAITALLLISLVAVASANQSPINTITYSCEAKVKLLGATITTRNFNIQVDIFGDAPDEVNPQESVLVENSYAIVSVPSSTIEELDNILGWNSIVGSVNKFEIISDNVPQVINVANPSIPIAKTPVPKDGSDFVFRVPSNSNLIVGPFTAGTEGVINVSAGNIETVFQNGDGIGLFSLDVDCQPTGNPLIKTVTIKSSEN